MQFVVFEKIYSTYLFQIAKKAKEMKSRQRKLKKGKLYLKLVGTGLLEGSIQGDYFDPLMKILISQTFCEMLRDARRDVTKPCNWRSLPKAGETHHRRPMGYENNVTALLNLLKKIFKYRYSSVLRVPEAMWTSYAIEDLGLKILCKRFLFFIIRFLTVKTTHASLFNIFFFIYCSRNR